MLNLNTTQKDSLPSAAFLIFELAKKYNIEETTEEVLEKISRGEDPNVTKISKLIQEDDTYEKIVSSLRKRLSLPMEEAERLAKDLEEQVLPLLEEETEETIEEELNQEDPYKEIIE
ncbi:MAG: hypothetical protein ABH919_04260 [bacterium]